MENDDWKMWVACKIQGHPVSSGKFHGDGEFCLPEDAAVFLWSSFDFCYVFLWWVSSRSSNLTLQLLVVHRIFDEIEST